MTLTVATASIHTAAGGTAVIRANGAGFSPRPTVREITTATPQHLVPAPVTRARSPRNDFEVGNHRILVKLIAA